MTFSKILVPYDGSKYAEKALNKAISLAKMMRGSEIIILNIMEEIPVPLRYFQQEFGITKQAKIQPYQRILGICKLICDIR